MCAQVGRSNETHQSDSAWISVVAEDIDAVASAEYADGQDAIDVAVGHVAMMIDIRDGVAKGRQENPRSFPMFGSTDKTVIGRRVVASLLNAGWRPPPATEITDAVKRSAAVTARFRQWLDGLRPEQRTRARALLRTGRLPARPPATPARTSGVVTPFQAAAPPCRASWRLTPERLSGRLMGSSAEARIAEPAGEPGTDAF